MLSETQIEQYFEDGYVIPDYRIPEETIIAIQDRHNELLVSHPEFRDYCPAILQYDEGFADFCSYLVTDDTNILESFDEKTQENCSSITS